MRYKTMVLELLQQNPQMYDQLRKNRTLLPTLERLASELKTSHEALKDRLSQAKPGNNQSQIAVEALEIALKELEGCLPTESSPADEALSLDAAMAHIRRHTPPE